LCGLYVSWMAPIRLHLREQTAQRCICPVPVSCSSCTILACSSACAPGSHLLSWCLSFVYWQWSTQSQLMSQTGNILVTCPAACSSPSLQGCRPSTACPPCVICLWASGRHQQGKCCAASDCGCAQSHSICSGVAAFPGSCNPRSLHVARKHCTWPGCTPCGPVVGPDM
jgi:hypothetical protein